MPWKTESLVSLRHEFVQLAAAKQVSFRCLCQRFGVSPKTGYKWLARHCSEGVAGLEDLSRKPMKSPGRTIPAIEAQVAALREKHPFWGARKLRKLLAKGGVTLAPSTITAILKRHGMIDSVKAPGQKRWKRFEHPVPNSLWQMDFKGCVAMMQGKAHPLTVLDDHSRFNICLKALENERTNGVQTALTESFRRYGLPWSMNMDNGPPWGDTWENPYTPLTVWLLRLGIRVSHSRPYHPQTNGKDERFHRTLKLEVLQTRPWQDLAQMQSALDDWRPVYNCQRPHEALDYETPVTRYSPSQRPYPETLPKVEYDQGATVRIVGDGGRVSYKNQLHYVPKAFKGLEVELREHQGTLKIIFQETLVKEITLQPTS
jgi:transposase InsO family protein